MPFDFQQGIRAAWIVVGLVWLIGAFITKRTARHQPAASLIVHICLLVLAFTLLSKDFFRRGFLRWRFVPDSDTIGWTGFALTAAGAALAIWARLYIGRNWSGTVTLKQDHELVRSGPYSVVRHPIYSGLSLAFLGTALAVGEVRCLIAFVLLVFEFKRKSVLEERFMIEEFGSQYVQYRREVKALIPFAW
ncbi:MAG: isoprenylcysteine carboxylmethyltransferase family protein [Acidobacteriia bacterium]|nr:isoprenylcysteine carboxylmethyltransferase family protein [Terriglobia bacterium]